MARLVNGETPDVRAGARSGNGEFAVRIEDGDGHTAGDAQRTRRAAFVPMERRTARGRVHRRRGIPVIAVLVLTRRRGHRGRAEVIGVDLDVRLLLGRHRTLLEDRGDRAGGLARATVNALVGIDVELRKVLVVRLALGRVDAVHRTDIHTRAIFDADTRRG